MAHDANNPKSCCFPLTFSRLRKRSERHPRASCDGRNKIYGPLFVTIDGTEKKITEQAQQAWILSGGRYVVYSSSDGAGGYENEGQSLHLYDVRTGKSKRIMSEYFMVEKVTKVVTSKKKRALLVELEDGGLGASYVAVVDPLRGEVFFRRWARNCRKRATRLCLDFTEKMIGISSITSRVKRCGLTEPNITI